MSRLTGPDPEKALPEVIFIDSASGSSGLDEHPDNNVQTGTAYVQSIIAALMQSNAWQDSVFILMYDEGGGLYDYVPPFAPDPNNGSPGYRTVGQLGGHSNQIGVQQFVPPPDQSAPTGNDRERFWTNFGILEIQKVGQEDSVLVVVEPAYVGGVHGAEDRGRRILGMVGAEVGIFVAKRRCRHHVHPIRHRIGQDRRVP